MATELSCTQMSVICFLTERGGRVRKADLIKHFRSSICTEPERKAALKEAFKSCVDSVAVEYGEEYVCLRKRMRDSVKRQDDHHHHGAEISPFSLSAPVTQDNRTDDWHEAVKPGQSLYHELNNNNHSSRSAKQERACAKDCAGACARTPVQDGSTSLRTVIPLTAHKPEYITDTTWKQHDMDSDPGHNHMSDLRSDETLLDAQNTQACSLPKLFHLDAPSEGRADEMIQTDDSEGEDAKQDRTGGAGSGSLRIRTGVCAGGDDEGRTLFSACNDSNNNTPTHDWSSVNSEEESPSVQMEPTEHEWMMCACHGEWDTLRPLLDSQPNLLSKKDFVTGFTCLHWAAKQGKHELLARFVNFARKRDMVLDVNARSSAGYTPLHLAAMHNHVEVIKLLVGACDASVDTRDYSGKKASRYLRSDVARDVLDIAGAETTSDPESDEDARWRLSRVFQANLRLRTRSATEDDDRVWGISRDYPFTRKASHNKLKPRLGKVRSGVPPITITHNTSHCQLLEGTTPLTFNTRPKSNVIG